MAITWTKYWSGSDDGTVLKGIDIRNIQDDLSVVQTVDDVLDIPGQTQGDLLYYNGVDWTRIGAGTDGQVLMTKGLGFDPEWGLPEDLVISGQTTGDVLQFDGTNWVSVAASTITEGRIQLFTADGTFTAPAGVTTVYLTMVGAGGGGGGDNNSGGGGGGGGGESIINYPYTVTPASNYAVIAGTGGTAGTNSINGGGAGTGEASSFDGTIIAAGGIGGQGNWSGGDEGLGGAGAGGIDASGSTAANGTGIKGGNGGNATANVGGAGGGSCFGKGGVMATAPSGYGSGGNGSSSASSGNRDGANGFVIVMY